MCLSWNSVTHYSPSTALIAALTTKVLAEAASYIPGASCPYQLRNFANVASIASLSSKALEILIAPSYFANTHYLLKYHGKTALLVCGTAIIGFGLYEGLCGAVSVYAQSYGPARSPDGTSTATYPFNSMLLNSISLSCSGLAKIFSGKAMVRNGISIKV
jgi:hypothetical protein